MIFGYDTKLEPNEAKRLNLPELSEDYVETNIVQTLSKQNITKVYETMDFGSHKKTTWFKKVSQNSQRPLYNLSFIVQKAH